eukprot:SAG11_NODE_361_length_10183_cov_4.077053_5_plen_198_part_00
MGAEGGRKSAHLARSAASSWHVQRLASGSGSGRATAQPSKGARPLLWHQAALPACAARNRRRHVDITMRSVCTAQLSLSLRVACVHPDAAHTSDVMVGASPQTIHSLLRGRSRIQRNSAATASKIERRPASVRPLFGRMSSCRATPHTSAVYSKGRKRGSLGRFGSDLPPQAAGEFQDLKCLQTTDQTRHDAQHAVL